MSRVGIKLRRAELSSQLHSQSLLLAPSRRSFATRNLQPRFLRVPRRCYSQVSEVPKCLRCISAFHFVLAVFFFTTFLLFAALLEDGERVRSRRSQQNNRNASRPRPSSAASVRASTVVRFDLCVAFLASIADSASYLLRPQRNCCSSRAVRHFLATSSTHRRPRLATSMPQSVSR